MALTIDATVGGATSNSFITLPEAETYMEGRGNKATWTAASDANKNIVLVEATREISLMAFIGIRASSTQAISWPRDLARDPDDPNNDYFASTVVPTRVKNASAELAFQYMKAGTTDLGALPSTTNIKRKKVDVLETEYFSGHGSPAGMARFPIVINQLQPLLEGAGLMTPLVRG